MKKYNCRCGGTAIMESIVSIKTMLSKRPIYAWRIVCNSCKTGMYDLMGSSTHEKAELKFNENMKVAEELAREFNVTTEHFLKIINN